MLEMKFYETKDFKLLNSKWRKKLKQKKFKDHEDQHENLKQYDRRTCLFENRDLVLDYFLRFDSYLHLADIPPSHRQILELYTQGKKIVAIADKLKVSRQWVHTVIRKHKKLVK